MKPFQILDLIFRLDLRNDQWGVCHGSAVNAVGIKKFFGADWATDKFKDDSDYLYCYDAKSYDLGFFPQEDILMFSEEMNIELSAWEIEN